MKKILPLTLGLLATGLTILPSQAEAKKDGYEIKVNFKKPIKDSVIYLCRYFGKGLPTIYKIDSSKVVKGQTATFTHADSVLGGMHLIMYNDKGSFFQVLLNNGDNLNINLDSINANPTFTNSPENKAFSDYENFMTECGVKQEALKTQMAQAKTKDDSTKVVTASKAIIADANKYRQAYVSKNPNTLLSVYFRAMDYKTPPEGTHYKADGKTVDSNFNFYYIKSNYWDGYDFKDNRLVISPILDGKLNDYFSHYVVPIPDSFNTDVDALLGKMPKKSENFKYSLTWLANYAFTSKVMGMDEAFVHLVEQYYANGDAYWLDSAQLTKYTTQAAKIKPNIVGVKASDLILQDVNTLQDKPLYNVKSPYTLMVFWSPDCGHCQKEIPQLDSLYRSNLKKLGVTIYSVPTEGELSNIQKFITQNHIGDWTNVVDVHNKKDYVFDFDVEQTPTMFLLDENKKIIGKKLDHSNVLNIIKYYENKKNNVKM